MQKTTTIAIVDDKPALISSLKLNLGLFEDIELLFVANNGLECIQKLQNITTLPQVILMDIEMPTMNGIEATKQIFDKYGGQIKIIMLTVFDQEDKIFGAIQAGASGYLMKDEKPIHILNAINDVLAGGAPMSILVASKILDLLKNTFVPKVIPSLNPQQFALTKREIEILEQIAKGLSYRSISELLFISDKTVKKHVENIYEKLQVNSKFDAIQIANKIFKN